MTNWLPDLTGRPGPRYQAIADALASDVTAGHVKRGDRLPTHRDLAWRLGVTVGTVSRAYAEAERRGLIAGEVGRGTYVRDTTPMGPRDAVGLDEGPDTPIDLTFNFPPPVHDAGALSETLRAIADDPGAAALLGYQRSIGRADHRAAGTRWLALSGIETAPERVLVTAGAQHGVLCALAALTRPGDRIAVEALTYPGIKLIARMLGLELVGIPMDGEGLLPEAFDAACRRGGLKALYCIPTLQNPTTGTLPEARRRALAEIARRHGIPIVEDDIMRLLREEAPPPIATFAPELTYYVTSLSKTVAPGLRIGFVATPPEATGRLGDAARATCWMTPPLTVEVGARWIENGAAERLLAARRREGAARRTRLLERLGPRTLACPPGSLHLWLCLPAPWRANDLVSEARARGLVITPADAFAVSRGDITHAVRLCFGAASDQDALDRAADILAKLLDEEPPPALGAVV